MKKLLPWALALMLIFAFYFVQNNKDLNGLSTKPTGGSFSLQSNEGMRGPKDFTKAYKFLYFGYTFCPDICPTSLSLLTASLQSLKIVEQSDVIFITVDPERDSLEALSTYVSHFPIKITPLWGPIPEIEKVTQLYGAYFRKEKVDSAMQYAVDHSAKIYMIDGDGKIIHEFQHGITVDEFKTDFLKIQDKFTKGEFK